MFCKGRYFGNANFNNLFSISWENMMWCNEIMQIWIPKSSDYSLAFSGLFNQLFSFYEFYGKLKRKSGSQFLGF